MHPTDSVTPQATKEGVEYRRYFTKEGEDPFETVEWGLRDVTVGDFQQDGVEAPESWSDQSVGVVAKLYFATVDGVKENSVRQLIERVVATITDQMEIHGYFGHPFRYEDRLAFANELVYAILHQYLTFNTPVWLNLGVPGRDPYCAACYLLSTEDHMVGRDSITDWWAKEALIFKSGAGSGINLSTLRGSMEPLSTGGTASGPVAYMRPADAGAGTLKSGGAHRRAAKFVRLDDDHPDIKDFITVKQREDERMRALMAAGFNLDPTTIEGEKLIAECTSAQNANISVGVHDAFMEMALGERGDTRWPLVARVTQQAVEYVDAGEMLDEIAAAAWRCGDPGVQFHDTINDWHTTPSLGEITTSNPCGETLLNDDSSCNIASFNLLRYMSDDGRFDIDGFCHHVDLLVTAMDATCSFSKLPTERIEKNTRELRQLGMGYANLGAALMAKGLPYDSDEGRDFAAAVTALMTGRAYKRSAHLAEHLGAFTHWEENRDSMLRVIGKHIDHITPRQVGRIWDHARVEWTDGQSLGEEHGYRNSQVTLVAPTGTTSFMLGCDTTGIEPAFSLVSYKSLAGGGSMKIVNGVVARALFGLGYDDTLVMNINRHLNDGRDVCDFVRPEHQRIFQTSVGDNSISPLGHVRMVAAVQPFLSQGISKTVNMPEDSTPDDIKSVYVTAWKLGLKSISVYRDNSKATQVLATKPKVTGEVKLISEEVEIELVQTPQRRRMPRQRDARIIKFSIDGHEGYLHTGMYESGELGEIFLSGIGKDGSTLRGICDAFATDFSIALQYGVPLETLVRKHAHVAFPPSGPTGDPDVPVASSIVDYIARKLAAMFLPPDICEELGVLSPEVKRRMSQALDEQAFAIYVRPDPKPDRIDQGVDLSPMASLVNGGLPLAGRDPAITAAWYTGSNGNRSTTPDIGQACRQCGANMQRTGTCWSCPTCFATTGCG